MDDEPVNQPDDEIIEPVEPIEPAEPVVEKSMEERRQGVALLADDLDSGHSRTVELRTVENVMEDSYLRYSMSVIIDRALPDVRDGLKPVHRRILYAMNRDGLRSGARHRKIRWCVWHNHGQCVTCLLTDRVTSVPWTVIHRLPCVIPRQRWNA